MVLSKPDLLEYLGDGRLLIEPPVDLETQVGPVSIDLHLGRKFTAFKPLPYVAALKNDPALWEAGAALWDEEEADAYILKPKHLVLAHTRERVRIPGDLVGFVEGRSGYARLGVSIHITAPKIDPGFDGTITLEMANLGSIPIELRSGVDRPAQLILMRLSTPLKSGEGYGSRATDKFQYQSAPIPGRKSEGGKSKRR